MSRAAVIGLCTGLLLLLGAGGALACDTGSWLALDGWAAPGGTVTVTGGGFDPGRVVLVWDRSAGPIVGEAEAAADGRLETQVRIPAEAGGGHKLIAVPAAAGDSPAEPLAWTDLVVAAPGGQSRAAADVEDEARGDSMRPVGLAAGVLTSIFLLGWVRRRRSHGGGDPWPGPGGDLDAELVVLLGEEAQCRDLAPSPEVRRETHRAGC